MRTLVIASETPKCRLLCEALARRGHQPELLDRVAAVSEIFKGRRFELVWVEVNGTGAETVDLIRRLHEASAGHPCILVALADQIAPELLDRLLIAGADDCLTAPFDELRLDVCLKVFEHRIGKLEKSRLAEAVYEATSDAMLMVDRESGQIVEANLAACQLLGYSPEELIGLSVLKIHPPESYREFGERFQAIQAGQPIQVRNVPCQTKEGTVLYTDIAARIVARHGRLRVCAFLRDVTETKRIEASLQESEARHRLIAENVGDMIWMGSAEGLQELRADLTAEEALQCAQRFMSHWRFTFVSPSVERILGYTPEEFLTLTLPAFLNEEAYRQVVQLLAEELLLERQPTADPHRLRRLELQHFDKDGNPQWCEVACSYLRDEQNRIQGIVGVSRDVTERKQADHALRESEATLRGLIRNMPDLLLVVNAAGIIQFANRNVREHTPKDLIGKDHFSRVKPEYHPQCRQALEDARRTRQVQQVEVCDIFEHWWTCRIVPMIDGDEARNVMIICTDVTEQREAQEAIRQEQDLLRQLLELHERDRQLIAFELHDGFAQQLTGAMFNLQAFREMGVEAPERAWKVFGAGVRLVGQSIEESRRLVSGLCPPVLEEFGMIPAIENLITGKNETEGPEIEFVCRGHFPRLARPLENAVFRIVQETLTNACRYSQSEHICVELSRDEQQVCLRVRDWGVGFDPGRIREDRFGLRGIRERARLLGGSATIQSVPGDGTCIGVVLPLVLNTEDEGHLLEETLKAKRRWVDGED